VCECSSLPARWARLSADGGPQGTSQFPADREEQTAKGLILTSHGTCPPVDREARARQPARLGQQSHIGYHPGCMWYAAGFGRYVSRLASRRQDGQSPPHRFIPGARLPSRRRPRADDGEPELVGNWPRHDLCSPIGLSGCLRDRFIGRRVPPLSSTPGRGPGDWRCVGTTDEPSPRYAQWFSHGIA
jgi:hypothetical protein